METIQRNLHGSKGALISAIMPYSAYETIARVVRLLLSSFYPFYSAAQNDRAIA